MPLIGTSCRRRHAKRRLPMLGIGAVAGLVLTASLCAAQDQNLSDAQAHLEAAWASLQATPSGGSHRGKALAHVRAALEEVHRAELAPLPGAREEKEERKREGRDLQQERKRQQREEKIERKQRKREEKLEERGQ